VNCVLLISFPIISCSYFLLHRCTEKSTGKIIHIILCIRIHSSFGVLNLLFPACRPNFSEAARTTQNIRSAGLECEVTLFCATREFVEVSLHTHEGFHDVEFNKLTKNSFLSWGRATKLMAFTYPSQVRSSPTIDKRSQHQ